MTAAELTAIIIAGLATAAAGAAGIAFKMLISQIKDLADDVKKLANDSASNRERLARLEGVYTDPRYRPYSEQ